MTTYPKIHEPEGGWRDLSSFTDDERKRFLPMAETLAMLDGNAFFGNILEFDGREYTWAEQYLPEAHALFIGNGGDTGWAGLSSFALHHQ